MMDITFPAKPHILLSSISFFPSSSSHFRRELLFLGCSSGIQLRPPGLLRSIKTTSKPGRQWLKMHSPRCLFRDSDIDETSVLLVVTAAAATLATLQLIYFNYNRQQRRATSELSEKEGSTSVVSGEVCNHGIDIMKHEVLGNQVLGSQSLRMEGLMYEEDDTVEKTYKHVFPEKAHVVDIKDTDLLKSQSVVLEREEILINNVPSGGEFLPLVPSYNVLVNTTGTKGSTSFSVKVNETEALEQGDFTAKMPVLPPGEETGAVAVSNIPVVEVEPIVSCSSIPVEKNKSENKYELDHKKAQNGEILVSAYKENVKQHSKQVSDCNEDRQPVVRSASCIKSPSTGPHDLTFRDNNVYQFRFKTALEGADVLEQGSPLTADNLETSVACFKQDPMSNKKEIIEVHGLTRDIRRSPMLRSDNGKFPQQNGFVREGDDATAYMRAYNYLLRVARLRDCVDLLESMERKGLLDMQKVHHTSFLKACKSQKAVKEAFSFCKLIRKPALSTYNMLLSVCASSQDFDGAFQVMLLVKEAGFRPDCKLYTTLISTCAKSGKVDAMFEVFHEMVNAGVEPNVNTYGALIDGCARAGQVAKAFGAYGIMRSKKVKPDRVVFNALITACGQSGAVDRAFDVLAEMRAESESKPIDPDHVTVGALIKTCSQCGQIDRVREVYKMLSLYNIKGTPDVYTIAVNSCSQTGDLEFALSIYEDMKKNGIVPDEMFLSALIDVAGHAGMVDVAFEVLQDARTKGIQLGNISYSSLMGACCNAKNWQKALELHEHIKTIKLLPTVSTLNALVTSLCDGDQLHKSLEVLDEMKAAGVRPNIVTYSVLIVACEKKNEAELSFKIFSKAKKDGILPNLIMCRCLTGLCLKSLEKASSLSEPIVTFNSGKPQIDNKWTSQAIMVYRETISAGVVPTIEVFSQVLGCLKYPHDSSLRSQFVENLGINFDASKCPSIYSLLDGFGEYDTRCFNVLAEAASLGVVPQVSLKDNPIIIDASNLLIHTVEVYLLAILKGLKHRLAAGARLPNINIILPLEKTQIKSANRENTIILAGRVGQAVGSLLRRLGLRYQGAESRGKIRINGLTLRRWFKPKLTDSSLVGRPEEMVPTTSRLAKGISDQQRSIRSNSNFTLENREYPHIHGRVHFSDKKD